MANQIRRHVTSPRHREVSVTMRLVGAGASVPTVSDDKGEGSSVARTSEGLYVVTLNNNYVKLTGYSIEVLGANGIGADIVSEDIANGTFTFTTKNNTDGLVNDIESSDLVYITLDVVDSKVS